MSQKIKTSLIVAVVLAGMLFTDYRLVNGVTNPKPAGAEDLPVFNQEQLAEYTGDDPAKPVYLALDGYVYDVSPGRADFYDPGESYHYLTGKDSSQLLHLVGGNIIKSKYKIVGVYRP